MAEYKWPFKRTPDDTKFFGPDEDADHPVGGTRLPDTRAFSKPPREGRFVDPQDRPLHDGPEQLSDGEPYYCEETPIRNLP